MTVFKDDDGKAYVIFGSGWHTHVQIAELTDDDSETHRQILQPL